MSPIIDLQRRLREVGRIRLGERVETKDRNGKPTTRPSKLASFRFTSADERAIHLVAEAYGGDVQPWDGASVGKQFELYTTATSLEVIVPPVDLAFEQWMELYAGGICQRRCDGQTNKITDTPCECDPDATLCKPTTHLGVILTGIDGIGIWRLSTHGWSAASELNGTIEVLRVMQNHGAMVPARLILEQRQQKKLDNNGKPATFNFAVPVLDLNLSVSALMQNGAKAALDSGVTPLPSQREVPSVAEQAKAIEVPQERVKRSNSAAPIRSTGAKPRPATTDTDDRTEGGASQRSLKRLMAILNGKKLDDDARHVWARNVLGWDAEAPISFSKLTQSEISKLNDAAETAGTTEPAGVGAYTGAPEGEEPF